MEFGSERSRGDGVKDEKRSESGVGDDEACRKQETVIEEPPMTNTERAIPEDKPSASSSKKEEADELENAKAEMGEVIEENQRLKMCLNRVMNDYRTLQMQFHDIAQQETKKSSSKVNGNLQEITKESELVSLSLGRHPSNARNDEKAKVSNQLKEEEYKEELALGLDCKFETSKSGSTTEHLPKPSPANSSEVPKEEAGETRLPSKGHKTLRDAGEDEVSQDNPAKKPRVCVRAKCDTPTLNDGCQWRKYGQKISKGNPCPRAYYRCTVAPSCPVRKQVQRCSQDMSILVTTYEGTHNHPLPLSATGMASTTSAAVSMLLSGSSTSNSASMLSTATATTSADLHGLNFYLSDSSKSKQFYLSHPALSSSSQSHPTITLDLTSNPPSSSSAPFGGRFTSNYNPTRSYVPSSTTCLNFSSSESNALSWSNGFLSSSYGVQPYNNINRNILSSINLGRQVHPMENMYHSYMQRNQNQGTQNSLPDTIAAATKVITADPTFQSALAAALASIIGTGGSTQGNQVGGENSSRKTKWEEMFPASSNRDDNNIN